MQKKFKSLKKEQENTTKNIQITDQNIQNSEQEIQQQSGKTKQIENQNENNSDDESSIQVLGEEERGSLGILIQYLKMEHYRKTQKEADYIYDYLSQYEQIKNFLQKEDINETYQLCRNMTHKKFYTGDIILKEGQESNNKLYILLKGKIGIVIKNYNNVYAKIEEEKQAKREVEIQRSMQENYKKYQKFTTEDARRINQKIIKELQRISIQKQNLKKIVKHNLYKYSLVSTNQLNYRSDKNIINNKQNNIISESSQDISSNSDTSDDTDEYDENGDKVFGLTSNNLEKNPSILEYKNRQRNSLQQNSFGNTFIHSYKKNGSTTIQQQKIRQSRSSLFLPTPKDQPVLSKRLSQLLKLKEQQFKYKNQQNELQIVKKQKAIKNFQRIVNKIRSNTKVVNSFIQLRQRRIKQVQEIEEIVSSYGTIVNTLQEGQIVGEKALTADNPKDAKRNATVICLEDTDCIIMQRKDFLKIKNAYDKESISKTKLIQQLIPPFENINNKRIKYDIINYFKPCQVGKGQKLYEEDQKGDKIYLVKDGKLEITKKSLNQENLFYDENRQIKISLIDEPQIIGEELIQQQGIEGNYKYTVNALEFTNLYYLVKSDLLYRFPQDFQTYIKQASDNREQLRKIIYDKNNRQAEQKTGKLFEIDSNLKMLYYIDNHEIFSNMNEKNVEKQYKHAYHQLDNKVQKKKKNIMNQSNISQQNEKSNNQLENNIKKPKQYIPDNIDPQLYQDYVKFVYQEKELNGLKKIIINQTLSKYSSFLKKESYNAQEQLLLDKIKQIQDFQQKLAYNQIKIDFINFEDLQIEPQLEQIFKQSQKQFQLEQQLQNQNKSIPSRQSIISQKRHSLSPKKKVAVENSYLQQENYAQKVTKFSTKNENLKYLNQKQQEIEEKYEENHEWKNQKIKSNFFANTGPSIEKYAKINFSKNQQPQIKIEIIDNKIVSNQQEKVYDFGQMKAFNKGQQQHLIAKGAIKGKKDLDYTQVKQNLKNQPLDQIKHNISAKKQKIFKKTIDMLESQQKMYSFVKPALMENQSANTSTLSDNLKGIKRNIFTQKNKSLSGQNFLKQDIKEQQNQTHLLYSKYQENSLLNKIPLYHKSQNLSSNSQISTNHNFSSVQKTFSQTQQINQQLLKQRQEAKSQSNIFQSVSKDSEKETENFVNNLNSKNQLAIQKSQKSSNNSLQYSYNKKQNQQQFSNKQIKFSNNNQQINEIENDKSIINISEIQNQSKSYIQIDEINEQESINDKRSQLSQECDDSQKHKSKLQENDILNQLSNNTNQQLQQSSSSQRMKKIFKYIPKSAKNQRQLNVSNCNQSQKIFNSSQMKNNSEKQQKKHLNQSDINLNQRKHKQKKLQANNTKFMQYNIAFSQQEQNQILKINKDQSVQGEISQQNSESYNENNVQDFPENTYFLNETNQQIYQQSKQQLQQQILTKSHQTINNESQQYKINVSRQNQRIQSAYMPKKDKKFIIHSQKNQKFTNFIKENQIDPNDKNCFMNFDCQNIEYDHNQMLIQKQKQRQQIKSAHYIHRQLLLNQHSNQNQQISNSNKNPNYYSSQQLQKQNSNAYSNKAWQYKSKQSSMDDIEQFQQYQISQFYSNQKTNSQHENSQINQKYSFNEKISNKAEQICQSDQKQNMQQNEPKNSPIRSFSSQGKIKEQKIKFKTKSTHNLLLQQKLSYSQSSQAQQFQKQQLKKKTDKSSKNPFFNKNKNNSNLDSQQNTLLRLSSKLGSNSSKHAEKFVQRFIAPQQSPEEVVEFCKVFDNNDSFIQK